MTRKPIQKVAKLGQLRTGGPGSLLAYKYWDPSISNERWRYKLRIWYVDWDEETYPKIAKVGQLGTGSGSRDLLLNFGTLYI